MHEQNARGHSTAHASGTEEAHGFPDRDTAAVDVLPDRAACVCE